LAGATLAGLLGWSAISLAQAPTSVTKPVPDAQVEASVLKALAGASDLANQQITTTTVYGVVTLSGSVQSEALRTEAETIVSRTVGVQKVIDEMTLPGEATNAPAAGSQGGVLQSDGTMAPPSAEPQAQGSPDSDNTQAQSPNQESRPNYGPGAPEYRQPYAGQQAAPAPASPPQQQGATQYPGGYGPPPNYGAGSTPGSGQPQGYPQQQGYPPQQTNGAPPQGYAQQPGYTPRPVYGGQEAGESVTIPSGALVRIRINQTLDSAHAKPGDHFDGIVVNDVVGGSAVAIPRGAIVQGTVIDAKKSGALAGRGELSLQLVQVTLGGKSYPIVSDLWAHNGADKAVQSVNSTVVGGGIGALIGAAAGGGEGAAIGAGVGGLLGLGSSAASHTGQVFIPSEGMLTFHLAQPATVATVSQAEMDRMALGVPVGGPGQLQRRYPYPPGYYGPGYRPYPYPY
jgi:hypothetical protein